MSKDQLPEPEETQVQATEEAAATAVIKDPPPEKPDIKP